MFNFHHQPNLEKQASKRQKQEETQQRKENIKKLSTELDDRFKRLEDQGLI